MVTDSAGNVISESDYYPWGRELQFVNNDANHYKFTGNERDSETGLDMMGARNYSSALSRFATTDPLQWLRWQQGDEKGQDRFEQYIENPQNFNLYEYSSNSPARYSEPSGLYVCTGTRSQCSDLKSGYNKANEALKSNKLTKNQKADLRRAIKFLGKPGEANGVVVKFGSVSKGAVADTHSSQLFSGKTLTTITFGTNAFSSLFTPEQVGQVFIHESIHGIDGDARGGRDPITKAEELATERNAYGVEADVAKGLNIWSPWGLWDPSWSASAANKNMNSAIQKGAQASTSIWCANGGNCK